MRNPTIKMTNGISFTVNDDTAKQVISDMEMGIKLRWIDLVGLPCRVLIRISSIEAVVF